MASPSTTLQSLKPFEGASERTRHANSGRAKRRVLIVMLVAGDSITLAIVFVLAYLLRFSNPAFPYLGPTSTNEFYSSLVFATIPVWLILFALQGLYNVDMLFGGVYEYSHIAHATTLGAMFVVLFSFLDTHAKYDLSRAWLVFMWLLAIALVTTERFLVRRFVYWLRKNGHLRRRALIVGANPEGLAVAAQFSLAPTEGLEVVGLVGRRKTDAGVERMKPTDDEVPGLIGRRKTDGFPGPTGNGELPIVGCIDDLPALVSHYKVDEIVVAPTAISRSQLLDTYQQFGLSSEIQIRLSPGLFEMLTTGARIREIGYVPLVSLNRLRIMGTDAWLKTGLDYALVVLASPFLLAICLIIAVLIKLDSPGPVFHRRRVLGVGGRSFHAYKFRTMVINADEVLARLLASDINLRAEFEMQHKLTQDPRVTRLGRFIRRISVDELPQLLNVLLGQMSLVGPRMISQDEIDHYGHWWMNLLTVKPGITGPWQVKGRSELPYDERVRLSMNYIRNYTIWSDLQILYQTIGAVLSGRGAF